MLFFSSPPLSQLSSYMRPAILPPFSPKSRSYPILPFPFLADSYVSEKISSLPLVAPLFPGHREGLDAVPKSFSFPDGPLPPPSSVPFVFEVRIGLSDSPPLPDTLLCWHRRQPRRGTPRPPRYPFIRLIGRGSLSMFSPSLPSYTVLGNSNFDALPEGIFA